MAQRKRPDDESAAETALPFTRPFNLARLPETGTEIALVPNGAERAAIATWAGVELIESFAAKIALSKRGPTHIRYDATFDAEITQACVVTLDPVPAKLSGQFTRDFVLASAPRRGARAPNAVEAAFEPEAEEGPETLPGTMLDLAGPLLEEFALSIEPYPRAPGAVFATAEDESGKAAETRENPFAVLQKLKKPE